MKITFTETHQSSLDGINVIVFEYGKEYDLPNDKATRFIDRGVAKVSGVESRETKVVTPEETKPEAKAKKKK